MVYQTEKMIKDLEGKIGDSEKAEAEAKKDDLKKAIEGGNIEEIKDKMKALESSLHAMSEKLYQQAAQAQQAQGAAQGGAQQADDGVVDADYTDVN